MFAGEFAIPQARFQSLETCSFACIPDTPRQGRVSENKQSSLSSGHNIIYVYMALVDPLDPPKVVSINPLPQGHEQQTQSFPS